MKIVRIVILSLSGLMLLFVGTMRLTNPIKTYLNNSGIKLANEVDLLNEIRGISALMLMGGLIAVLGIFFPNMTFTSFMVGSLIFLGFVVGRLISFLADGKPNKKLIMGVWFEIILGAANVFGFINIQ